MLTIIKTILFYLLILLVVRIFIPRQFSEIKTFNFVILVSIGVLVAGAIAAEDYSFTNATIAILTFVFANLAVKFIINKKPNLESLFKGAPLVLIENGEALKSRMTRVGIGESEILEVARKSYGIENIGQIKYAVLEKSGEITVIKKITDETGIKGKNSVRYCIR